MTEDQPIGKRPMPNVGVQTDDEYIYGAAPNRASLPPDEQSTGVIDMGANAESGPAPYPTQYPPTPYPTQYGSPSASSPSASPAPSDAPAAGSPAPAPHPAGPQAASDSYPAPSAAPALQAAPEPYAPAPVAAPGPMAAAPGLPAALSEVVSCPECGASQDVYLNRRDASDFCRHCDFPLFWTPSRVQRDREALSHGESLRRLPGTVGRSTLASVACPHCAELNLVAAQTCVRCGQSMHPVIEPPPVVYTPPPPPPPAPVEVIPERGIAWWVWVLLALFIVAAVTVTVLAVTHHLG